MVVALEYWMLEKAHMTIGITQEKFETELAMEIETDDVERELSDLTWCSGCR